MKCSKTVCWPGLCPGPSWGSLERSPRPPIAGGRGGWLPLSKNPSPLSALRASHLGPHHQSNHCMTKILKFGNTVNTRLPDCKQGKCIGDSSSSIFRIEYHQTPVHQSTSHQSPVHDFICGNPRCIQIPQFGLVNWRRYKFCTVRNRCDTNNICMVFPC